MRGNLLIYPITIMNMIILLTRVIATHQLLSNRHRHKHHRVYVLFGNHLDQVRDEKITSKTIIVSTP
jgi:hypothetical protein